MKNSALRLMLPLLLAAGMLFSCNRDEEYGDTGEGLPVIEVDSESGVYAAKVGRPVRIVPTVENGRNAAFSWTIDGEEVSAEPVFERTFEEEGRVFVTLRVSNASGSAEKELRIDVGRLALPLISLAVPATGLELLAGAEYLFEPDVQNAEHARFAWYLGEAAEPVATTRDYLFCQTLPGSYDLRLLTENDDGQDERRIEVRVVESLPVRIDFIPSCYGDDPLEKSVFLGRKLFLRPHVSGVDDPRFAWYVDDVLQEGCSERLFAFEPAAKGTYRVRVRVTDGGGEAAPKALSRNVIQRSAQRAGEATLRVTCYERESERRIVTAGRAASDRVLEYLPAPGQFVNERTLAGFCDERTFEAARQYAERRLEAGEFVSLGCFGGYLIVGFDHSIENRGGYRGYDFSIAGNQFDTSNEPGVVWVMQDVNANGLPDDEWYELRSSETDRTWTVQEYAVTYYKPSAGRLPVLWTDNRGGRGKVAFLGQYHEQESYYPRWLEDESYTYYGTCLRQNTAQDPGGDWSNNSYDWGYVDNEGTDNLDLPARTGKTYFKIAHAMTLDGQPAELRFVDFVKVQCAVNASAGALGELSTEVCGPVVDENIGR